MDRHQRPCTASAGSGTSNDDQPSTGLANALLKPAPARPLPVQEGVDHPPWPGSRGFFIGMTPWRIGASGLEIDEQDDPNEEGDERNDPQGNERHLDERRRSILSFCGAQRAPDRVTAVAGAPDDLLDRQPLHEYKRRISAHSSHPDHNLLLARRSMTERGSRPTRTAPNGAAKGVSFQPASGGQYRTGLDTHIYRTDLLERRGFGRDRGARRSKAHCRTFKTYLLSISTTE
jgi:hypothetical protein